MAPRAMFSLLLNVLHEIHCNDSIVRLNTQAPTLTLSDWFHPKLTYPHARVAHVEPFLDDAASVHDMFMTRVKQAKGPEKKKTILEQS